jgi:hypothetical protein
LELWPDPQSSIFFVPVPLCSTWCKLFPLSPENAHARGAVPGGTVLSAPELINFGLGSPGVGEEIEKVMRNTNGRKGFMAPMLRQKFSDFPHLSFQRTFQALPGYFCRSFCYHLFMVHFSLYHTRPKDQ